MYPAYNRILHDWNSFFRLFFFFQVYIVLFLDFTFWLTVLKIFFQCILMHSSLFIPPKCLTHTYYAVYYFMHFIQRLYGNRTYKVKQLLKAASIPLAVFSLFSLFSLRLSFMFGLWSSFSSFERSRYFLLEKLLRVKCKCTYLLTFEKSMRLNYIPMLKLLYNRTCVVCLKIIHFYSNWKHWENLFGVTPTFSVFLA